MNSAKTMAQQRSGTVARTRRYLYALLALNLAIMVLIAAFFWYHQKVQDRIFDSIVNYHDAVGRAAQTSLVELHYISDELWRRSSLRGNPDISAAPEQAGHDNIDIIRSHISALTKQQEAISSLQQEHSDPRFATSTNAALQAFDPVLRIGAEDGPGEGNLSARLELVDDLGARLRNLLALHLAEEDRLTVAGPHFGLNHPEYLIVTVGFLTLFGLAAGFGVVRNVTVANAEREAAFQVLLQNERDLRYLTDGLEAAQRIARVGNWEWDRETGMEWWSDENFRIIGHEPGTVAATNETFFEAIHEKDRNKVAGVMAEAERNTCSYQVDFRVVLAGGELRYVREIGEPVFDPGGRFTGQRGTIQDITDQYLAESKLAETVRHLEAAQRIARVADWEWNPDSNDLVWPPRMWEILGLPQSDEPISNDSFIAMLHPDDRQALLEQTDRAVANGEPYAAEYRYISPDGETKTILEYGEPFTPEGSSRVRLRGTIQDITEQKTAEQKLADAVADLNRAQRLARVGSWTWDIIRNENRWSDECYRIHGLEPGSAELSGTDYLAYVHPDDRESVKRAHDHAIATGEPLDIEFRLTSADGIERIVHTHGEVSYDANGCPLRITGTLQDVSELRHREREFREIQERFSLAFQLSPSATAISEVETGIHIDVNDKWVEVLGHPREEAIGRTASEMGIWANPEDRARAISLLKKDGRFRDFEAQYRTRSGEPRDFMISAEPFPIGDKPHMLIVGYDITERKAMERELRETADKLKKSQRAGKIGSWVWEIEGDKEWWSDEIYRLVGLEVRSVVLGGYGFLEFVHPDDRERIREAQDRALHEGVPYDVEYRWVRTDGVELILSEYGEMEYDANGKPVRMHGTAQDITERKAAEENLRETARNLEESQRIAKLGSWVWDIRNDKEWWSDELYRMVGWDRDMPYTGGREFLQYVHPDDRERVGRALDRSLDEGVPYVVEYRFLHADGHEIILSEHAETEYDESGKPLRMRGTTQDVTELKRIEQDLARLNAELEKRVDERTAELRTAQEELVKRERLAVLGQLTATVSHELRNPLGAIRTSLFVIEAKTGKQGSGLTSAISRINRSIARCDNIIDELLDFTRMREPQTEPLNIDHWLMSVIDEQHLPSGVSLNTDFNAGDLCVPADPDRLRRAVINVYENACHALEAGGVNGDSAGSLFVSTRAVDGQVEIIVEDTGPGIPKDTLERIFEPLYSTKNFGVGLGLPIVQQIMQQHGGSVEVRNRKVRGAVFVLRLPLERGTETASRLTASEEEF